MTKNKAVSIITVLTILLFPTSSLSAREQLKILFGLSNSEPFAFIEKEKLVGGIIKDIGDALGKELDVDIQYINVPRKRQQQFLNMGRVHASLISNPAWFSSPEQYSWSIPAFTETNVLTLSAKRSFPVKTFADLAGKRVGCIRGFSYSRELEQTFDTHVAIRDDVNTFIQNVRKLMIGRIDCFVSSNIAIGYHKKRYNAANQFVTAEKLVSERNIQALFSKQCPISIDRINAAVAKLKGSGTFTKILKKYR